MNKLSAAVVVVLAAGSPALAQSVQIDSVSRSARLRCFAYAPDRPDAGEEWSVFSQQPGHWDAVRDLDAHTDSPSGGMGMAHAHLMHNSEVHPEMFMADGDMNLDTNSSGVCSTETLAESVTDIHFTARERVQMHIHADIDPPGGDHEGDASAGASITITTDVGQVLLTGTEHIEEMLVLPAGSYVFTLRLNGQASCSAEGHSRAFIHFHYDANFMPPPPCEADFNGDAQVDFFDYLDFAQAFSEEAASADFNHDGQIDFFDYLDFALAFDAGC